MTREEHAEHLIELAAMIAPAVFERHKGREATPHLLTVIEMEVHDELKSLTELPFVLTISLTKAGLVVITVVPPTPAPDPIEDAPLVGLEVSGTRH